MQTELGMKVAMVLTLCKNSLHFNILLFTFKLALLLNLVLEFKNQKNILPWTKLVRLIWIQKKDYRKGRIRVREPRERIGWERALIERNSDSIVAQKNWKISSPKCRLRLSRHWKTNPAFCFRGCAKQGQLAFSETTSRSEIRGIRSPLKLSAIYIFGLCLLTDQTVKAITETIWECGKRHFNLWFCFNALHVQ